MKNRKKFSLSLRVRVTIIASITMAAICAVMSMDILHNVNVMIIGPTQVISNQSLSVTGEALPEAGTSFEEAYSIICANIDMFYEKTLLSLAAISLLGILITYTVLAFSLRPLKSLQKQIGKITERDLSKRIDVCSGCTELDMLSQSFNQLLDRLEAAFVREKNFSAGAAHELKTPLTVIKTNLDVLSLSEVPTLEEYGDVIEVIKNQTARMKKLVEDLFAMCSLNGYDISEKVNVEKLLYEIAAEQQMVMQEKNIKMEIQCAPCTIQANSVMLKHALSNIVQNAVKYNLDGGKVCVHGVVEHEMCIIKVSDNGIGISGEAAGHIFEPFFREDKSRSRKIGGAGLGLSITKDIVEQHKGTVSYQPNQPRGACFIVRLPVEKSSA